MLIGFGKKKEPEETKNQSEPQIIRKKVWYDIHGHFLPLMDDGCTSAGEAVSLLQLCRRQGIAGMIATPHYDSSEAIEAFLARRQRAYELLTEALEKDGQPYPKICLGAETAYSPGMIYDEDFPKLVLGSSSYMLIELPVRKWDFALIHDIKSVSALHGITPVIAHLERHLYDQPKEMLRALYETEALIEMDAEAVFEAKGLKDAKKRIHDGYVQVMGSDVHNMVDRRPNLREAADLLDAEGMTEAGELLRRTGKLIFDAAYGK